MYMFTVTKNQGQFFVFGDDDEKAFFKNENWAADETAESQKDLFKIGFLSCDTPGSNGISVVPREIKLQLAVFVLQGWPHLEGNNLLVSFC